MQVTNATTDGDDDDDEVGGNSMGNQGWSDMILPTITNTASHRVLSNRQRVIVPPLVLRTWVHYVMLCNLLEEGSLKVGILLLLDVDIKPKDQEDSPHPLCVNNSFF